MTANLNQVRKGMRAYGPDGDEIGTVEFVYLSDEDPTTPGPDTVTPSVEHDRRSLVDHVAGAFRTAEVPETLRARLLREGFVRLDATGLFAADRYVLPDQIASVSGDRVALSVRRDELLRRGPR